MADFGFIPFNPFALVPKGGEGKPTQAAADLVEALVRGISLQKLADERGKAVFSGKVTPTAVTGSAQISPAIGPVSVTPAQFLPFSRSLVEGTGPVIAQTAFLGKVLGEILKRFPKKIPRPQPRTAPPRQTPRQTDPARGRTTPRQGTRQPKTFRTKREEALEAIRQKAERQSSPIPNRPPGRAPGPIIFDDPFRSDFPLPAPKKAEPIPEIVSRPTVSLPPKPVLSPALLRNLALFGLTVAVGALSGRSAAPSRPAQRQPSRDRPQAPTRPGQTAPAGVAASTLVRTPDFVRALNRQRLASQFSAPARPTTARNRCPPCDKPRRRNRKTCWEGFYAEYSKRTEFKKWRQVDCLTRRTIQEK